MKENGYITAAAYDSKSAQPLRRCRRVISKAFKAENCRRVITLLMKFAGQLPENLWARVNFSLAVWTVARHPIDQRNANPMRGQSCSSTEQYDPGHWYLIAAPARNRD